jgi:hypothetical protein
MTMPIRPIKPVSDHTGAQLEVSPRPRSRPLETSRSDDLEAQEPDQEEYEVGYGKPPQHTRFKPGQSGNPRGRPKVARGLNTIVRTVMNENIVLRTSAGEKKIKKIDGVLQKTIEFAMKGNMKALIQLVTLYRTAVPEAELSAGNVMSGEELSATDLATLEELKALFTSGGDLA